MDRLQEGCVMNIKALASEARIRTRGAAAYLGMEKSAFNPRVRPGVTVLLLGKRAVAFDRLELDGWMEAHFGLGGRSAPIDAREAQPKGVSGNLARIEQDRKRRTRRYWRELKRQSLVGDPESCGHEGTPSTSLHQRTQPLSDSLLSGYP
jgi:predicted DNA-binding transcriptional regulator AlpA